RLGALGPYPNSSEPALIRRLCKFVLKPSDDRVTRHLREKHDVPKAARCGLTNFIRSLNMPDPNKLALRPDGSPCHPHLACEHCDYRTTSRNVLSRQLGKCHRRRKTSGWMCDDMIDGIFRQSWVQSGVRGFWIVEPDGALVVGQFDESLHQMSVSCRSRIEELHSAE
ncbi:hypothetical protein K469DRAFT_578449, partial [Zopfia rhizophila CBS 207.26]